MVDRVGSTLFGIPRVGLSTRRDHLPTTLLLLER
jgi:hypothetical protein